MARGRLCIVAATLMAVVIPPAASGATARTAQHQQACMRVGGDLTNSAGMARYQNCMAGRRPVSVVHRNPPPPVRPVPQLQRPVPVRVTQPPNNAAAQTRALAAFNSAHAHPEPVPGAIALGCQPGYVWREKWVGDHTCIPLPHAP